ncbi:MAG: TlpA family protein disulfide reductase, partial [Caldilinea sp.]
QTPTLVEAHRQWREEGIQFVGVNVKEDFSVVEPYVQQHGIEYPILLDADGAVASVYAVQGYPTTYFLDGNNRIVARHVGALTKEQLQNYLLALRLAQ